MIVPVAANVQASRLETGRTVLLNENMVVVSQAGTDAVGAVRTVKQVIDDGRLLVADGGGNVALVRVRERCRKLRSMCPTVLRSIRP